MKNIEMRTTNTLIGRHTFFDVVVVHPHFLRQVVHLIGKGDFDGKPSITSVLDHLGNRRGNNALKGSERKHRHNVCGDGVTLLGGTKDLAIREIHVLVCGNFRQKLRIIHELMMRIFCLEHCRCTRNNRRF